MPDAAKAELLRSLGRVVRGLSALFWGLPLMLISYVETARTDWLDFVGSLGLFPVLVVSGLIWYGLAQMRGFQKQERIWQQALNRAEVFAILNLGLAPFLFWWHRLPYVPLYSICVGVLVMCCLLLLIQVNQVLLRLTAMLPDEMLRSETRMFTTFNTSLLALVFALLAIYFGLQELRPLPSLLQQILSLVAMDGVWLTLFLILMPLAMTMALIWKVKEVIFASVFDAER